MTVLDRFRLDGRVAVVTGGNRGLGRAFAQALAEAGADVAVVARDDERSQAAAGELAAAGTPSGRSPRTLVVHADVTRRDDVERMLDEVTTGLGPVDVLVNNAGYCIHRPALEVTDEEWRAVLDVNLDGLWRCCQVVGRQMAERGTGTIVNIGSMSADIVNRPQWQPAYNASKAAVHHLTRSLAAEWAPLGIRVNALAPGYTKTEMAPVDEPQFRRYWIEDAPMQRYTTPEELGPSLLFLASDASSFMTGAVLTVDGGYSVF
jgi:NAD(P)-dependent dehydrogenase (short-subunit alcohol dehydrogenase family)